MGHAEFWTFGVDAGGCGFTAASARTAEEQSLGRCAFLIDVWAVGLCTDRSHWISTLFLLETDVSMPRCLSRQPFFKDQQQ